MITRLLMIVLYINIDIQSCSLLSVDDVKNLAMEIDVRSFVSLGSIESLSQVPQRAERCVKLSLHPFLICYISFSLKFM